MDTDSNAGLRDTSAVGTSERAAIIRALCAYVSESLRVAERWASEQGIHHTDVRAMAALGEASRSGSALSAGQLGAVLGLSSPATSALITRLEAAGHLTRMRDPHDRRRVLLSPSASALRSAVGYFQPMGDAVSAALVGTTEEERVTIAAFLQRLADGADI